MPVDDGYAPAESVTVRDQLAVVVRRWRVIVALIVVGLLASGLYTATKSTKYISHADVRLKSLTNAPFTSTAVPIANTLSMPTEQKTAQSLSVANAAAKIIGGGATGRSVLSHVVVSVPTGTNILDFGYTAKSAVKAQAGANAFEKAYLANRESTNLATVDAYRKSLDATRTSLDQKRTSLTDELDHATDQGVISSLQSQLQQLTPTITANNANLEALGAVDPLAATITQTASLPEGPAGTSHKIVLVGGFVGGLVLGLIAAFILDATDDHVLGPNDLVSLLGVPVLARVPLVRSAVPWRKPDLASDGTSHPKVAEAYRLLANRLIVAATKDSISSLLIASPGQGEGRSSVAANLSATFVELGFRVWLVSADLVPPQVHRLFSPHQADDLLSVVPIEVETPMPAGTTNEMAFGVESEDATGGHLTLMASVARNRPAGRLLNPFVLARQVRRNQEYVDITIVDAPALLDFADAIPLLPVVDGVVVVADAGATRRSEMKELADLLEGSGARMVGSVLNRDGSRVVSRRARRARRRISGDLRRRGAADTPTGSAQAPPSNVRPEQPSPQSPPQPQGAAWPMPSAPADSDVDGDIRAGSPAGAADVDSPTVDGSSHEPVADGDDPGSIGEPETAAVDPTSVDASSDSHADEQHDEQNEARSVALDAETSSATVLPSFVKTKETPPRDPAPVKSKAKPKPPRRNARAYVPTPSQTTRTANNKGSANGGSAVGRSTGSVGPAS